MQHKSMSFYQCRTITFTFACLRRSMASLSRPRGGTQGLLSVDKSGALVTVLIVEFALIVRVISELAFVFCGELCLFVILAAAAADLHRCASGQ